MAKTVLVVDNSASLRLIVTMALIGAGYEVLEAVNGSDALSKLDGNTIHLIISPASLTDMDGIGFVNAVKQQPIYKFTPVIMLATESGESKKAERRTGGVTTWLETPFQPAQMMAAVSKLILP